MVFSSTIFVFLFLPAAIFTYAIVYRKSLFLSNLVLLLFSMAFYFYGEPKYILVMIFSISANYAFGLLIHNEQLKGRTGKWLLCISVVINLAVLVYFKYLTFITENINAVFGSNFIADNIVMPIGISFYTFQAMSYVFDIYNSSAAVQKNPLNVALYISMFPQLIAGPIVRYETIAAEIKSRTVTVEKASQGIVRFIYGFGKKIILANSMGAIADQVFSQQAASLTAGTAWIGAIAYAFQIYYDFSGYSDMAIGLGKLFGFTFLENFNYPYISKSITEFWRRWHISLSTWFRDYVYIPLGGNRAGPYRKVFNIFAVWLLTGLWHGASWNFVVWGLYFAVILSLEKAVVTKLLDKCPAPVSHLYALVLIIVGWVIFRSDNLTYAISYIARMFSLSAPDGQSYYYLLQYRFEWIAALIFSVPIGKLITNKIKNYETSVVFNIARLCGVFSVFILSIIYLVSSTFNPFIYFRF